jgi:hypothetical protein
VQRGESISLQDIIKQRQQADFVGREERLAEFRANLVLPVTDPARRFLFNVHGVAGVGKTFLTHQFRRVAAQHGAACAYADENSFDVLETMVALADDLAAAAASSPTSTSAWTPTGNVDTSWTPIPRHRSADS